MNAPKLPLPERTNWEQWTEDGHEVEWHGVAMHPIELKLKWWTARYHERTSPLGGHEIQLVNGSLRWEDEYKGTTATAAAPAAQAA